jgi:hypothetical protein
MAIGRRAEEPRNHATPIRRTDRSGTFPAGYQDPLPASAGLAVEKAGVLRNGSDSPTLPATRYARPLAFPLRQQGVLRNGSLSRTLPATRYARLPTLPSRKPECYERVGFPDPPSNALLRRRKLMIPVELPSLIRMLRKASPTRSQAAPEPRKTRKSASPKEPGNGRTGKSAIVMKTVQRGVLHPPASVGLRRTGRRVPTSAPRPGADGPNKNDPTVPQVPRMPKGCNEGAGESEAAEKPSSLVNLARAAGARWRCSDPRRIMVSQGMDGSRRGVMFFANSVDR